MFSFLQLVVIAALGTTIGGLVLHLLLNLPKYLPKIKAQIPALASFFVSLITGILVSFIAASITLEFQVKMINPPLEQRIAILDFQLTKEPNLFGSNPAVAQAFIKYVNASDYKASRPRILYQHHDGGNWLDPLSIVNIQDIAPGASIEAMLSSHSRENVEPYLKDGGKLYFGAKVEWTNPNGSYGCKYRFIEIGITGWGDSPHSRIPYQKPLSKPPKELEELPITYPCQSES